jgi:hypothetical protein
VGGGRGPVGQGPELLDQFRRCQDGLRLVRAGHDEDRHRVRGRRRGAVGGERAGAGGQQQHQRQGNPGGGRGGLLPAPAPFVLRRLSRPGGGPQVPHQRQDQAGQQRPPGQLAQGLRQQEEAHAGHRQPGEQQDQAARRRPPPGLREAQAEPRRQQQAQRRQPVPAHDQQAVLVGAGDRLPLGPAGARGLGG